MGMLTPLERQVMATACNCYSFPPAIDQHPGSLAHLLSRLQNRAPHSVGTCWNPLSMAMRCDEFLRILVIDAIHLRLKGSLPVEMRGPEADRSPFSDRRGLVTRFLIGLGSCREGAHLLPLARVLQENPLHRFPQVNSQLYRHLVVLKNFVQDLQNLQNIMPSHHWIRDVLKADTCALLHSSIPSTLLDLATQRKAALFSAR
eukprot:Skav222905  [mRNA]  locus=scaffold1489:145317:145922:- [translate_table: standard]